MAKGKKSKRDNDLVRTAKFMLALDDFKKHAHDEDLAVLEEWRRTKDLSAAVRKVAPGKQVAVFRRRIAQMFRRFELVVGELPPSLEREYLARACKSARGPRHEKSALGPAKVTPLRKKRPSGSGRGRS